MKNNKRRILLLFSLCISVSLYLVGCGGKSESTIKPELISFISSRSGQDRIYVMDFAGNNVKEITIAGNNVSSPTLSPGGLKVAYVSTQNGNADIYVANIDNTDSPIRITTNTANDIQPTWSPNGDRLAWTREANNLVILDTVVVKPFSGDEQNLIGDARNPCWSPTGDKLAFSSKRDGAEAIFLYTFVNSSVSKLSALPQDSFGIDHLSWSTNDTIAYGRYNTLDLSPSGDIYFVKTSDGTTTQLIVTDFDEGHPAWSISGNKLVYYTNRDGNYEIYCANSDGTGQLRLTNNAIDDGTPGTSRNK